jgi:threonine synthase
MIGNPVSMPRVIQLVEQYNARAGCQRVHFVQVAEQEIMDWQLRANRNGHIACTHGGECLAGLKRAVETGLANKTETAIIDSTAHALKFAGFQDLYFSNQLPAEYDVAPQPALMNAPIYIHPNVAQVPAPGRPLSGEALDDFVQAVSRDIALDLKLVRKIK